MGKTVLVGLTYLGRTDEVVVQVQLHGKVSRISPHYGIGVTRAGTGELFWLPPDLRAFEDADPGEYRLRSTGEVLVNPDLISTWTISAPAGSVDPDWRETLRLGFAPSNVD